MYMYTKTLMKAMSMADDRVDNPVSRLARLTQFPSASLSSTPDVDLCHQNYTIFHTIFHSYKHK